MKLKKSHGVPEKNLSGTSPVQQNFSIKAKGFSYEFKAS